MQQITLGSLLFCFLEDFCEACLLSRESWGEGMAASTLRESRVCLWTQRWEIQQLLMAQCMIMDHWGVENKAFEWLLENDYTDSWKMTTLDKWITIYFDLKLLLLRFSQKYFICVYGSRTDFCFWQENYSRMDHFAISCEQDIGKDKEPKENCNDSFRSTYSRGAIVKEV